MSLRRSIAFSTALHDLRARNSASPYLTATGAFDRSAIMRSAIAEARKARRSPLPSSWRALLSMWLKLIWAKAKRAAAALRPAAKQLAPVPVSSPADLARQIGRLRYDARQAYLAGHGAEARRLSQEAQRIAGRMGAR